MYIYTYICIYTYIYICTLCYAIMLQGRKSGFRAGFRPDSNRENIKIGPPADLRPAGVPILRLSRLESGRSPARKPDFRPGSSTILRNIKSISI